MITQLQKIFGQQIQSEPYSFPEHTPVYIRDGFTAQRVFMSGSSCIVITPTDPNPSRNRRFYYEQNMVDYRCK